MAPSGSKLDPPAALKQIGRYRIVRPLSKGGMALVYEGRRESLAGVAPRVAIKVILPEHADSDTFQELFINEARLGAAMQHQNLVQIQDFDRDDEHFFLVMEYVEGLTLRRICSLCSRHGIAMPMNVLAEIGRQVCDGLHYAHSAVDDTGRHLGLVHRDVKPSNLILSPQGVIKILDFGISKGALLQERKGAVKGTWGYMAPEQATGREVGPAADVFALAIVLYEMSALKPLFRSKSQAEIKRLLMDDHAVRMMATLDESYGPLVEVLMHACLQDPKARYPSAEAFSHDLANLLPDPITATDELMRFYKVIYALDQGESSPGAVADHHLLEEETEEVRRSVGGVSPFEEYETSSPVSAGRDGLVWLFGLTLVALLILVFGLWITLPLIGRDWSGAGDTPLAGGPPEVGNPAGSESPQLDEESPKVAPTENVRPPPTPSARAKIENQQERPEPERPAVVTVDRSVTEVDTDEGGEEDTDGEPSPVGALGSLTLQAEPSSITYDVFVDGRFIKRGPVSGLPIEPGIHLVTISATDGRRKRFEVTVVADKELRKTWDFNRNQWRR